MIMESGEYYATFYHNKIKGYWAAFLVNAFLAIAAMLRLVGKKKLNLCIKIMMIPLFLVVVCGASLKIVAPMMNELAQANAQSKLLDFLDAKNQRSIAHLALFEGQKTNTALTIKHQRQVSEQLIAELEKNKQCLG